MKKKEMINKINLLFGEELIGDRSTCRFYVDDFKDSYALIKESDSEENRVIRVEISPKGVPLIGPTAFGFFTAGSKSNLNRKKKGSDVKTNNFSGENYG